MRACADGMIKKNLRSAKTVRSDYDRNATTYDITRFRSSGGQYVDAKEQEFVASVIKSLLSRAIEDERGSKSRHARKAG